MGRIIFTGRRTVCRSSSGSIISGFQMYRSEISHWNAYEMGPKRDVLGELEKSFEKWGMQTGASSHRVEHWFFMGHGKEFDSDIKEPMQRGDFYWPANPEPNHQDLYSEPTPTEEYLTGLAGAYL